MDTPAPFPDKSRVVFYGDSITRLGGGVLRVAAQYGALFPERDVRFFNAGISGGTLEAATLYLDGWIAPLHPTHVVLAFGVNDANSIYSGRLDNPEAEEKRIAMMLAAFRERYVALLERFAALGATPTLRAITPFDDTERTDPGVAPREPNKAALYRRVADEIRSLADERGLSCIDDWSLMSLLLASGENDFMPDRVHPVERGQWRLAENLLAAQGLSISPFCDREETAESAGLSAWDALSQRFANLLSAEWTFVRDETLDIDARMAKVRAWLESNETKLGIHPILVRFARDYLKYKPLENSLRATLGCE